MRIMWRAWGLGALVAAGLILSSGSLRAGDAPVVHLKAVVEGGTVRLEAEANGPFEYTTYRPSDSLYVVDLTGVSAADGNGARVVPSDLIKSYRVVNYASGDKPVVRVELLVNKGVEPRVERKDSQDLALVVSRDDVSASAKPTSAAVSAAPAVTPVAAKPLVASKPVAPVVVEQKNPSTVIPAIQNVHLTENDGSTEVSISGSGTLTYHATRLQSPDRLVLDFAGAHLRTSESHISSNLDPVREIRLAQFTPEVSRVVIDLRPSAHYNIAANGSVVTVTFVPTAGADAPAQPLQAAPVVTTTKAATTKVSAPVTSAQAKPAVIPAPPAVLPAALTQNSSALATPSAQVQPQTIADTKRVASEASTAANSATGISTVSASAAAYRAEPSAAASVRVASPVSSQAAVQGNPKFTGEPISVNLKDVDLRDFFRLIHEISGLNVVVDPAVKGNLTIVLDDVPWDQALDIVLKNNDLDKQLDGNVLRIATKETLRKEADENRDLAKAQAEAADVVTTTRVLSYAKATLLAATLKKFLSSRGDILADDRSNTLIIRDIPATLPVVDNLIRQLDRKSQQVEIEARVVAANRSFSREIGTQFGIATAFGNPTSVLGGTTETGTSPIIRNFPPLPAPPIIAGSGGSSTTSGSIPLLTNMPAAVPTSGIAYAFSAKNFALDMIITAAEERGVGKLLSKPKIITQNNQKATVKQGTKIPVQTIVNNTVSVQFVDAVLELDVTPQITAEGTVYMDVTVENDQIDSSIPRVQGIPAIDTQSAETKVTVNDGVTVVIGGIIVTTQRTDIQQVPLVGSVPVLGNLFKHTTVSSTSQELLFFLTPRILPG
jgi:type IV pilus secretin PilQ/predicted competence protein